MTQIEMIVFFVGLTVGAVSIFPYLLAKHRILASRQKDVNVKAQHLDAERQAMAAKWQQLDQVARDLRAREEKAAHDLEAREHELAHVLRAREEKAAHDLRNREETVNHELRLRAESVAVSQKDLEARIAELAQAKQQQLYQMSQDFQAREAKAAARQQELESRIISYLDLQNENRILKRDLQNIDTNLNKLELDRELQRQRQDQLDQRSQALGQRYLKETVKAVVDAIGANNFAACKQRLQKVIDACREIGFAITDAEEANLLAELRAEFEKAVRAEFEREEQARIKAQIREEQKLQMEIERELKQLDRERAAIQAALDRALAQATDKHNEEIQRLQARLAEVEEKSKRAISQAQLTKSGNVYVISNIGSFGPDVFKIGMTRRFDPLERVYELGSASVPFPFDVHMMIACNDAPALENALHRALHKLRLNKARPRKEFFKVDLETISNIVRENHGEVQYVADPEALEYRQSLTMSDADSEFIEKTYANAEDDDTVVTEDA